MLTLIDEQDLYARLIAHDPTASADLAIVFLDSLTDWLIQHNPSIDPHICSTAAEDAILAVIGDPRIYSPDRQSLKVFLRVSASGDLKNLLRSERRHGQRRARIEAVEQSPTAGKYLMDVESDPALIVERVERIEETYAAMRAVPAGIREGLSPAELTVIELLRMNERRTVVYAEALGLADQPRDIQRREVKRVKDRLKKRIERAGQGS